MGVINWINGIIGDAAGGLANLASSVASKIAWVYNFVVGFLTSVRATVVRIRDFVRNFLGTVVLLGSVVYTALKWLAQVALPRAITQMFDILTTYVDRLVAQAIALARSLAADVQKFVMGILLALKARVEAIFQWAIDRFSDLYKKVGALLDHVFGVLATPERLVIWILSALIRALVGWLLDNAVALGQMFWAARTRILLDGAAKIEDIVTRII